jgi:uncharacterized protein (DUF58 family)
MLTARGFWFLVVALFALAIGLGGGRAFLALLALPFLLLGNPPEIPDVPPSAFLALLGLTLLLWFAWEAFFFTLRTHDLRSRVRVVRELGEARGPVTTLWAGGPFVVRTAVLLDGAPGLPYAAVADRLPFGAAVAGGDWEASGPLTAGEALHVEYHLRCDLPGAVRFEGVRLRTGDLCGFFHHVTFLPCVQVLRVLPRLADRHQTPGLKRHNHLLPPGSHRLHRPGSGSELLDLRDYQPGDPPRTIAWKVSARRDKLITKEFESEVPVRCTLFLDTSAAVRLPSTGGKAVQRLVEIAAGAARSAASSRDLVGLCLFDENGVEVIRPDRHGAHLTRLLRRLAEAAALAPSAARADPEALLPLAYAFAEETYPERLAPELNAVPFWLEWVASFPGYWRGKVGPLTDVYRNRAFIARLFVRDLPLACLGSAFFLALADGGEGGVPDWLLSFLVLCGAGFPPAGLLALLAIDALAGRQRRLARWRKRLAALLAARHGLTPGGVETLLEDNDAFSLHLQRFLAEHQVPYLLPPYDDRGRYLFASPEKVQVLASALLRAVAHGHDNELFVLLADLLETEDELAPLLNAVKVALSRHHQVVLVCPWPPGLPPPGDEEEPPPDPRHLKHESLEAALRRRLGAAYRKVRRTFSRLGVPVVCAAGEEAIPLILDRLDRLRAAAVRSPRR